MGKRARLIPTEFFRALSELEDDGLVNVDDNNNISLSRAGRRQAKESKLLSAEEQELIEKISEAWGSERDAVLEAFIEKQLTFKLTDGNETVPYELITQENPRDIY